MYTGGIRKILTPLNAKSLTEAKVIANSCGFDCFTFNGDVYVKVESDRVKRSWCKSPFEISDFKVRF